MRDNPGMLVFELIIQNDNDAAAPFLHGLSMCNLGDSLVVLYLDLISHVSI